MDRTALDLRKAALLSMEMQRGIVGDLSKMRPLAEAAERKGIVPKLAKLMQAVRAAGATVIHCNAEFRADLKGTALNTPQLANLAKEPSHILAGTAAVEILPELGPRPEDIVIRRSHGMSPFTATSLDITLRNLGVDTVVAAGVSLNRGVLGMCIEAVGLGYRVVLARDCVAGFPDSYAEDVIKHSLAALCTLSDSQELTTLWPSQAQQKAN